MCGTCNKIFFKLIFRSVGKLCINRQFEKIHLFSNNADYMICDLWRINFALLELALCTSHFNHAPAYGIGWKIARLCEANTILDCVHSLWENRVLAIEALFTRDFILRRAGQVAFVHLLSCLLGKGRPVAGHKINCQSPCLTRRCGSWLEMTGAFRM